ncbi:NRDE-2, necessary for RNA interference-domain-containing protein [Zopfochytrium polystomum]|nr:NRDE-2, necessary for RNA interference-domain-containing protein [Zopfochytrium polystomum]
MSETVRASEDSTECRWTSQLVGGGTKWNIFVSLCLVMGTIRDNDDDYDARIAGRAPAGTAANDGATAGQPQGFLGSSIFPSFNPASPGSGSDSEDDRPAAAAAAAASSSSSSSSWLVRKPDEASSAVTPFSSLAQSFSSFPSFSFATVPSVSAAESTRDADKRKETKRSRDPYQGVEIKKKKRKHKDSSSSRHEKKAKWKDDHHSRPESSTKAADYSTTKDFYIDRRGDSNNLIYQSLPQSDIPLYRAFGNIVFGATGDWWIDRKAKGRRGVVIYQHRPARDKVSYKEFAIALKSRPQKWRKTKADEIDLMMDEDFVPLTKASGAEGTDSGDAPGSILEENADFLKKTQEFNKLLMEKPKDVQLWIDFCKLQDELIAGGSKRGAIRQAIAEKKLAILEKALDAIPGDEKLLHQYMSVCEEAYDSIRLLTKWDVILREHPDSIALWDRYLEFRQTNYASFTVNQCVEVYEECMETLRDAEEVNALRREKVLLHVFRRVCHLLLQAGQVERAIALSQAMVEFSCFCPPAFAHQSFDVRLNLFEIFWESGCPRFGEEGARTWANDIDGAASRMHRKQVEQKDLIDDDVDDEFLHWYLQETVHEYNNWLPLTDDQMVDDVEDPFRTVVFADIRTLLFHASHPSTLVALIDHLTSLMALPTNLSSSPSSDRRFLDAFLHAELASESAAKRMLAPEFPEEDSDAAQNNLLAEVPEGEAVRFAIQSFPFGEGKVIASRGWFGAIRGGEVKAVEEAGFGRMEFVKNILQQAQKVTKRDELLSPLLLALEADVDPNRALKLGKSMLKSDRMNLPLWHALAQINLSLGSEEEARKILFTAVIASQGFAKEQKKFSAMLHFCLAEMQIVSGRVNSAMGILLSLVDDKFQPSLDDSDKVPPTKSLRGRKLFTDILDDSVTPPTSTHLPTVTACFALYEYCTHGLSEALAVFARGLERLGRVAVGDSFDEETKKSQFELLQEAKARVIFVHSKRGVGYRPGDLREALEKALEESPHHSGFLELFARAEARTRIENRFRRVMEAALARNPSHILWTFFIWAEIRQRKNFNVNAVRALFERAVECPSSRHSVSLWYLFVVFEMMCKEGKRAKTLFYRAVRECPWAKALYMLPFRVLRSEFDDAELVDIYSLMEEKELRLRIPLG